MPVNLLLIDSATNFPITGTIIVSSTYFHSFPDGVPGVFAANLFNVLISKTLKQLYAFTAALIVPVSGLTLVDNAARFIELVKYT